MLAVGSYSKIPTGSPVMRWYWAAMHRAWCLARPLVAVYLGDTPVPGDAPSPGHCPGRGGCRGQAPPGSPCPGCGSRLVPLRILRNLSRRCSTVQLRGGPRPLSFSFSLFFFAMALLISGRTPAPAPPWGTRRPLCRTHAPSGHTHRNTRGGGGCPASRYAGGSPCPWPSAAPSRAPGGPPRHLPAPVEQEARRVPAYHGEQHGVAGVRV